MYNNNNKINSITLLITFLENDRSEYFLIEYINKTILFDQSGWVLLDDPKTYFTALRNHDMVSTRPWQLQTTKQEIHNSHKTGEGQRAASMCQFIEEWHSFVIIVARQKVNICERPKTKFIPLDWFNLQESRS